MLRLHNVLWLVCGAALVAQQPATVPNNYVLGADDQIAVRALDVEEFDDKPLRIDMRGNVNLPLIGRVHAAGMTAEQLEAEIAKRLKVYVQEPNVLVSIEEFRSQPVSILGAVAQPGVRQLQGRKTLFEVLSEVGGLRPDAGNVIKITRRKEWGRLPLPDAKEDPTGEFSVGEVNARSVMEAKNPQENILIEPNDVISVPIADTVYVIGTVKKPGGYVLNTRESISVLQVLALAGGTDRTASTQHTKILRPLGDGTKYDEIPVNLKKILEGSASDLPLKANDILFVPNSAPKSAALRATRSGTTRRAGRRFATSTGWRGNSW